MEAERQGYAPLYASFESFYIRNVYRRLKDVFGRPIASVPGAKVSLVGRSSEDYFWSWTMQGPGQEECINLASYNYLGFAENCGPSTEASIKSLNDYGLANCSSRQELGTLSVHQELEQTVAAFLGVEDLSLIHI